MTTLGASSAIFGLAALKASVMVKAIPHQNHQRALDFGRLAQVCPFHLQTLDHGKEVPTDLLCLEGFAARAAERRPAWNHPCPPLISDPR
mmetsp:Transcript_15838/g.25292  ORF Transcript_15838/g.25292 Transcript_15838/m.25292 type:complete len:90 (-) Transcript_15838:731-1000(-)